MTRKEYTESLLSTLRHVTRREREAIRAEIDGHIEDHMADLLELDYPPELAESQLSSSSTRPVMASSMPLYTEVCTIKEREAMKMTRMTNTMPMVLRNHRREMPLVNTAPPPFVSG